jgi:DNA-binding NarL/FixJ family response regulator
MEKERTLRVLLVSDKMYYLRNYRAAFEKIESSSLDYSFSFTELHAYNTAIDFIKKMDTSEFFAIICLQISIPLGIHSQQEDGSSLGIMLRRRFPEAVIILSVNFSLTYNIWNLINMIKPEAVISEDRNDESNLPIHIVQALKDPPYYCSTFLKTLKKYLEREIELDKLEQKLLYELSKGTRMAALPNILNMSISTIEKRKKRLKELFQVEGEDDSTLILKARESGAL